MFYYDQHTYTASFPSLRFLAKHDCYNCRLHCTTCDAYCTSTIRRKYMGTQTQSVKPLISMQRDGAEHRRRQLPVDERLTASPTEEVPSQIVRTSILEKSGFSTSNHVGLFTCLFLWHNGPFQGYLTYLRAVHLLVSSTDFVSASWNFLTSNRNIVLREYRRSLDLLVGWNEEIQHLVSQHYSLTSGWTIYQRMSETVNFFSEYIFKNSPLLSWTPNPKYM